MPNLYRVYKTSSDYRGDRVLIDNLDMPWSDLQALLGTTLLEFESSSMISDGGGCTFKGRYLSVSGEMESHGATILWDSIQS